VFRQPRLAVVPPTSQLGARAPQWLSCYPLLVALGLDHRQSRAASARIPPSTSAALPVTPLPNLAGRSRAACGKASPARTGYTPAMHRLRIVP
jgi:phosphatidylinositol alpha-mannosyltransferase